MSGQNELTFTIITIENKSAVASHHFSSYCYPGIIEGPNSHSMHPLGGFGRTREESRENVERKLRSLVDELIQSGGVSLDTVTIPIPTKDGT